MTSAAITTPTERSPGRLFLALFALALIIVGGMWFGIREAMSPSLDVVAKVVGSPIPDGFRAIYAQQTPLGDVAEFFDSGSNHKFSLARASLDGEASVTPHDLMNGIIEFQKSRTIQPGFAPLSIKFSQALFTGRSAYDLADSTITITGGTLPVLLFVTTKGAHHAMTILNRNGEQMTVLALKKNAPVDLVAFGRFIELALKANAAAHTPTEKTSTPS